MFRNKHIVAAMIIAPILAIISYFATDYAIGERPQAVEVGQSYALIARSNCRYASGVCTLVNGDLEVKISLTHGSNGSSFIQANSSLPLDGIRLALTSGETEFPAVSMNALSTDALHWESELPMASSKADGLRVAMQSTGAVFYASVGTDFFQFDERFPQPIVN